MYQVISYHRDRSDTTTMIRNHRLMGVKSLHKAMDWLRLYDFAELRKSTPSGFTTVAIIQKGKIMFRE